MKRGLELTLSEIPIIGGVVVASEGGRGLQQIEIREGCGMCFIYRDYTTASRESSSSFGYSYEELKSERFPFSKMESEKLTLWGYVPFSGEPEVMGAQANFLKGGMVLSVSILHTVSDALGLKEIFKAWGRNIKAAELDAVNGVPIPPAREMRRTGVME